jgi:predicted phosphoribosyltransferase
LPAEGKTAILVDDGIATGLTMEAAIRDVQLRRPARIVVAIPVAPQDTADRLAALVDAVVGLEITDAYRGAVGAYYDEFYQVSDEEVIQLLRSTP